MNFKINNLAVVHQNEQILEQIYQRKHNKKLISIKKIITEVFLEYCANSTLHGFYYIGSKSTNIIEKIWWIIMFLISMTCCVYLVQETWIKWRENPVILSFEQEQTPLWKIPFPAVTVCPADKLNDSVYDYLEYFENFENLNEHESKIFSDISLICNVESNITFNLDVEFTDEESILNIKQVAQHLSNTIGEIRWQGNLVQNVFTEQITEDGICFTFNSFNQKDMYTNQLNHDIVYINHNIKNIGWSIENGYPSIPTINDHPKRTAEDGFTSGLSLTLFSNPIKSKYNCGLPVNGFKIILHNPAESPRTGQQYILISTKQEVSIIVKPELTTTEDSLASLPPSSRKCYFAHEKSLRFFNLYTQNNCKIECLANITQQRCGCVTFFMPRDDKTKICGYGKLDCVTNIQSKILKYESLDKNSFKKLNEEEKIEAKIFENCACLQACTSLTFTAETSQANLHLLERMLATGLFSEKSTDSINLQNNNSKVFTQVDIFFKEAQFLAKHRSELFGPTDFFANIGGLLGLFMGFSILSFVEIFYFLTIRMWYKYKSYKL